MINHTKEFLIQESGEEFREIHNYSQWRKVKGFKISDVTFLREVNFFKLLINSNLFLVSS